MPSDQSTWLICVPQGHDPNGTYHDLLSKVTQQARLPQQYWSTRHSFVQGRGVKSADLDAVQVLNVCIWGLCSGFAGQISTLIVTVVRDKEGI